MNKNKYIEVSDNRFIAAKVVGTGEPILCISGFASSHSNFSMLAEHLKNNFQLIMIDNRGMGDSDDVVKEYEISDLAIDAMKVMESLGHDKFHVIGISMGGFVAQEFALKYSKNILSLSLLCTTSGGHNYIPLPLVSEKSLVAFYELETSIRDQKALAATLHPSIKIEKPELYQSILKLRQESDIRVDQVLLQKKAVDKFLKKKLALNEITIPTLIMSGANDRYVDTNNSFLMAQRIPFSQLAIIHRADHLFFFEKNDEVAQVLTKFLTTLNKSNQQGVCL